jgi:TolA-binding protein
LIPELLVSSGFFAKTVVFREKLCYTVKKNCFLLMKEDASMAAANHFRRSLNGFHREDVVHYIEYINAKHTSQVNQLESQIAELNRQLEECNAKEAASWEEKYNALLAQQEEQAQLLAQKDARIAELSTAAQAAAPTIAQEELEAYRRAERAERIAKERAEQIYQQATGTLAEATTQVDRAACQISSIIQQVNDHLSDLQTAVDDSKASLQDATAIMNAIRPNLLEEE